MSDSGLSRRDMLKIIGAGALFSLLPGYGLGGSASGFSPSGGPGLIFLVGDGMPLGVIKGMHQIRTRLYGDKDTNFYSRMKDVRSTVGYVSTESLSSIVTDSAPASVAWSTGSKTSNKLLASLPDGRPLRTIMELVKEQGYAMRPGHHDEGDPCNPCGVGIASDGQGQGGRHRFGIPEVQTGCPPRGRRQTISTRPKRKDGKDLLKSFSETGYEVIKERESLLAAEILSSRQTSSGPF